ncbi:MAG: hypothetical protein JRN52_01430 [Nitrososphaerota archaeon]|nr:hypothetical protein [Nitrososphaerota archaeon]
MKKSKPKIESKMDRKCPKCGGRMVSGVCARCNYSSKTAYRSRKEAKEFTYAGD